MTNILTKLTSVGAAVKLGMAATNLAADSSTLPPVDSVLREGWSPPSAAELGVKGGSAEYRGYTNAAYRFVNAVRESSPRLRGEESPVAQRELQDLSEALRATPSAARDTIFLAGASFLDSEAMRVNSRRTKEALILEEVRAGKGVLDGLTTVSADLRRNEAQVIAAVENGPTAQIAPLLEEREDLLKRAGKQEVLQGSIVSALAFIGFGLRGIIFKSSTPIEKVQQFVLRAQDNGTIRDDSARMYIGLLEEARSKKPIEQYLICCKVLGRIRGFDRPAISPSKIEMAVNMGNTGVAILTFGIVDYFVSQPFVSGVILGGVALAAIYGRKKLGQKVTEINQSAQDFVREYIARHSERAAVSR